MSEFLGLLKREVDKLEAELAALPAFQKLEAARKLLAQYQQEESAKDADDAVSRTPARPRKKTSRSTVAAERVRVEAARILRGRTQLTRLRDLMAELLAAGVSIPGEHPSNNLSTILTKDSRFKNHGREGWTLAETPSPDSRSEGAPDESTDENDADSSSDAAVPRRANGAAHSSAGRSAGQESFGV